MSDHPVSILGRHPERPDAALEALRRLSPGDGSADSASAARVQELLGRVRQRVAHIMARCASVDVFVAAQLGFASTTEDVEAVYADLQLFCRWHRELGEKATDGDDGDGFAERLEVCERLLESEALLANQINQWLLFLQSRQGTDSALRLFLSQVAAWHVHVKRQLQEVATRLEKRIREPGGPDAGAPTPSADGDSATLADQQADLLIDAGELETLQVFTDWLSGDRTRLSQQLSVDGDYPRRRQLVDRLWQLCDLLMIADPSGEWLDVLGRDDQLGEAFDRLKTLLKEASPDLEAETLDARFAPALGRAALDDALRAMLWRTVIVAHEDDGVRRGAAAIVPLDDLWLVLVDPRAPLSAVYVIAGEVAQRGNEDLHKVFFDCVKSRLMSALGDVSAAEELTTLGELIVLFFGFSFFIQTRYFEQLETLLHLFQAQSSRFGGASAKLGRDLHRLEIARHQAGSPKATDPSAIDRLPLPVQRHLAREGCYLTFFACHPNHLIAREVVHWVHADNLSRFLKLSELNRQMLEEAMRRIDLGGKKDLVLEVLTHPKCPMLFAGKHLPRLGRHELHRIVQSRSTHSEVKRKAMLHMIRQRGEGAPGPRP